MEGTASDLEQPRVGGLSDERIPRPSVEAIDAECFLIRNLLTTEEQFRLFEYIQERDKTPPRQHRPMVPAPRTLVLGEEGHPTIEFEYGDRSSIVTDMVAKAGTALALENLHVVGGLDTTCEQQGWNSMSMATVQYEVPDGHFPPHVDHCNDESLVFLASLGCTANFMVRGPTMTTKRIFKFHSGDLLVFNPSSKAAILHSVVNIDPGGGANSSSHLLHKEFPILENHRYGVQCRMVFGTKKEGVTKEREDVDEEL